MEKAARNTKSNTVREWLIFVVALGSLVLVGVGVFGPLASLQKDVARQQLPLARLQQVVARQNYQSNIQVNWEYPSLKRLNSWSSPPIRSFLSTPLKTQQGQTIYQAQFTVLNAPNDFRVECYIFKRIVAPGSPNTFQQSTQEIALRTPDKAAFGTNQDKPRIFKTDMVLMDRNPTTIVINVITPNGQIIKSEFYDIE